jgi:hypothetical protein
MRYMNDWDLQQARSRFTRAGIVPNRLALVLVVDNLREQTNLVSDGWAYWPKPCRAADKAMALIDSTAYPEYDRREREDITEAEMLAAVRPIKSFLTRHAHVYSAEQREIILRAVTS